MEKERITVVVPVYNGEKTLDRCLGSIVNQTYRDLEILLVDDGSQDRTPQMCDAWAEQDSRIRVIHRENAGVGIARNTGMEQAAGVYICFFDSDDYVDCRAVEKAYVLAKQEAADIVVFGMKAVDRNGKIITCRVPKGKKSCFRGHEVQELFLPDLIDNDHDEAEVKGLTFSMWSCLFSMELVRRSGWKLVSERQYLSEDSYSLIWLYRHVRSVAILPEALYAYCDNIGSLTHTYREDLMPRMKQCYLACIRLTEEQGYSEQVRKRLSGLYLSWVISAMKRAVSAGTDRFEAVAQIVPDETVQRALRDLTWRYHSRARRMLLWAMAHKLHRSVQLMVILKSFIEKRRCQNAEKVGQTAGIRA